MKYLKQVSILFAFTFISEILNRIIPLPIPASIYGLVFLFLCLEFKIIRLRILLIFYLQFFQSCLFHQALDS